MDRQISLVGARTSAGLTQQELADKLGVSRRMIIDWESGKREMRPAYLYAICQITGFSVNDIFLPFASTK